jgi:DNA-binding CsgD family transcriptional regulator
VADAWLLLVREREDFSAAAVATLSSVAMPLAAALKTLVALMDQRLHAALGQASLQKLGIGHVAFDDKGRVIAADAMAEAMLSFVQDPDHPGERRLQAGPAARQVLDQACADFASGRAADPVMLFIGGESGLWLLLGRAQLSLPEPCAIPAAIGSLRTYTRENSMHARKMLRTMYGLSINEAALAHELSLGKSIIEAGRGLNLTAETSRNYSKRIYAKTGATSQADLVRLILTGLSPLA